MNTIDLNTSNCAARNYAGTQKKHDPVNHLRLMMIDWTTRLESYAIYKHADRNCASGVWQSEDSHRRCLLHLRVSENVYCRQASHCHVGFAVTRFWVHGGLGAPHAQGGNRQTGHISRFIHSNAFRYFANLVEAPLAFHYRHWVSHLI